MNLFSAPELYFHPDMPPAELAERWLYLHEKIGKQHWPLELLPLLRVRYGGLLKDSILSVSIQSENAALGEYGLQVTDMADGVNASVRFSTEHHEIVPVVAGFLERCDDLGFAHSLGLFDDKSLAIMARLSRCQDVEDELEKLQGVAGHYLRCARLLARHIVRTTNLEAATVALLKSSPATGIADDEARANTRWDELVAGSASDSILSELWNNEVSSAVDEVFENQQPFAVQLAFWMDSDSLSQEIENCESDGAPDRYEDFGLRDLCDTHLITQEIANNVISLAMSEREENI